jgi:hypothetical protein
MALWGIECHGFGRSCLCEVWVLGKSHVQHKKVVYVSINEFC